MVAFALEAARRKRAEHARQAMKVKSALFVLISQRTFLRNLEAQHLIPLRNEPHRAFLLLPVMAAPTSVSMDIDGLTFLLNLPDKELPAVLEVADLQFRTVLEILVHRNRLHEQFQSRMEAAQLTSESETFDSSELKRTAGPMLSRQLELATDQLFSVVTDALAANNSTYVRLESAFRKAFPRETLWRIEDRDLTPSSLGAAV